jgi:tRNA dimethylallyltransferase
MLTKLLKEIDNKIIILSGATASGKSQWAIDLILEKLPNGVIINGDAQQVYEEIPIITAQPTLEDKNKVAHLLYGHLTLEDNYSVGIWLKEVVSMIAKNLEQGKLPIVIGGTGMYLESLVRGINHMPQIDMKYKNLANEEFNKLGNIKFYQLIKNIDPIWAHKVNINDKQRLIRCYEIYMATNNNISFYQQQPKQLFFPQDQFIKLHLLLDRERLYHKINHRFDGMIKSGVIEEIEALKYKYAENLTKEMLSKAIGAAEILEYLKGNLDYQVMHDKVKQLMRNYAKRQLTWNRNRFEDFIKI